MLTVIP